MHIDCNECVRQYTEACRDCVVTHLLHDVAEPLVVDDERMEALGVLAEHGLVPELRLVRRAADG